MFDRDHVEENSVQQDLPNFTPLQCDAVKSISDTEWKSGTLLTGNQQYFMTFEALAFFENALDEYAERRLKSFQVSIV